MSWESVTQSSASERVKMWAGWWAGRLGRGSGHTGWPPFRRNGSRLETLWVQVTVWAVGDTFVGTCRSHESHGSGFSAAVGWCLGQGSLPVLPPQDSAPQLMVENVEGLLFSSVIGCGVLWC